MRIKVFLKSGQSFEFDCLEFSHSAHSIEWVSANGQSKDKLVKLDFDAIEAIVRLK